MDTLTHALTGALAGRALAGAHARVSPAAAGWVGLAAAAFPDVDFGIAPIDPYAYLSLHRAVTHSLVMLPLWAALVAVAAAALSRGRYRWRALLPYAALGMLVHIAADLFNIWEVKFAWPLSDAGLAVPVLFVIDPLYTALVIAGLVLSARRQVRPGALTGMLLVAAYTAVQFPLTAHAERAVAALGEAAPQGTLRVYGQPLSPLHRRVVVSDVEGHSWAYLKLFAGGKEIAAHSAAPTLWTAYRPAGEIEWRRVLHPEAAGAFAAEVWRREEMRVYRDFAGLPYLYAVEAEGDAVCAWFADLRFMLPGRSPAFRWGMCRHPDDRWTRHRLGRW